MIKNVGYCLIQMMALVCLRTPPPFRVVHLAVTRTCTPPLVAKRKFRKDLWLLMKRFTKGYGHINESMNICSKVDMLHSTEKWVTAHGWWKHCKPHQKSGMPRKLLRMPVQGTSRATVLFEAHVPMLSKQVDVHEQLGVLKKSRSFTMEISVQRLFEERKRKWLGT